MSPWGMASSKWIMHALTDAAAVAKGEAGVQELSYNPVGSTVNQRCERVVVVMKRESRRRDGWASKKEGLVEGKERSDGSAGSAWVVEESRCSEVLEIESAETHTNTNRSRFR